VEIAFETDRGKVRPLNEDNGTIFFDEQENVLFAIVADGMGGHQAGEVASEMAVSSLKEAWENDRGSLSEHNFESWLREQIQKTNLKIYNYASSHPECKGMGTTIVAVICSNSTVVISHVGDSRCYHMTDDQLKLETNDHTLVNELVKAGQITKEEAEHHPRKHVIMRAVGTEFNTEVETKVTEWKPGDYLLLCSDGLSDKVTQGEIQQTLVNDTSLTAKAKKLIELAIDAGGEDNITLAVVRYTSSNKAGEEG
jgi:PPM family protein phosphatase